MSRPERRADGVLVHRALASRARTRLLEVLTAEPDLDAAALASRLELHVNTVRSHLGVLDEAGLVEPLVEERTRPGRPRLLYRVVAAQAPGLGGEQGGYAFLSEVLAGYLGAVFEDPAAAAEDAGTVWGRFAVETPPPFADVDAAQSVERLVALLDDFGFAPELDENDPDRPTVLLRHCPFLDVARAHPDVVCSIHLGLMRGALDELGVVASVEDLIPWGAPDGCVSHLSVSGS